MGVKRVLATTCALLGAGLVGGSLIWSGLAAAPLTPGPIAAPVTPAFTDSRPGVGRPLTRDDLEPWLDGVMTYAMKRGDVAGGVVVVVKDGQPLLAKGYGYSDVARRLPVDPATTMFRTGSTGKLFTWTAVMQLVEQHRLDLDADVNTYLDFKIPPALGKPVTLRELMQHTAGFEEHAKFLFVDNVKYLLPLDRFLKENLPARIFPPGEVPAYSNYGATLAGYIVQRVSGEPYEAYIQHHIFDPLGMAHSTLYQPPPAMFLPFMSKGYRLGSGPKQPFEIGNVRAAGVASNSGDDMGRFMLAHLNDGSLGSAQILQPATAELMHRQSFQATPPLPGFALGFYHEDRNGHDVIAHEGDTNFFHSNLELVLDQHLGFFISLNSLGKNGAAGAIRNAVFNEFMDRYYPAPPTGPEPTLASAGRDGALLAGTYQLSRRAQTDLLDLVYLISQVTIARNADGTLTVSGTDQLGGAPKRWREIAPYVWRDVDGNDRMAANVHDGVIKAVWFDETVPAFVLQPVPALQSKALILPLLGASMGVLLLLVLSWPLSAWARQRYGASFAHTGSRAHAYRIVRLVAAADLIFFPGMALSILAMASASTSLDGSNDWLFRLFQLFGLAGLLGVVVGPWNLLETWRDPGASWWAKLTSLAVMLAFLALAWLAFALHLLTPSLNY